MTPSDRREHRARPGRPRTTLRPTGRGAALALLVPVLWLAGDLLGLAVPRALAAATLTALALGLVCVLLARIGLDARREVLADTVDVGERTRIRLDVDPAALALRIPLGRGALRAELPDALGGPGDLPLLPSAPHALPVLQRGQHRLGPLRIVLRDVLGLFHLERTVADDCELIGVPALESIDPLAARTAGISREERARAASSAGEISPLARPYAAGDDIRRIHWRASARTGRLMTREEEAAEGSSAVIVLDTRPARSAEGSRAADGSDAESDRLLVEDRLVALASSLVEALAVHGWEVEVLDATGDRIAAAPRTGHGRGVLAGEAEAIARREARRALAVVGFDDHDDAAAPTDRSTGDAGLVIALGAADPSPFEGLDLDRFAGRAHQRLAIALEPGAGGTDAGRAEVQGPSHGEQAAPITESLGSWTLVRGSTDHRLDDLLAVSSRPAVDGAAAPMADAPSASARRTGSEGR